MTKPKLKLKQINIRVNENMLLDIKQVAGQLGMGKSEYLRMIIVNDISQRKLVEEMTTRKIV